MSNTKEQEFWSLLYDLRRGYSHGVVTMGNCCTDGCEKHAKGGGLCPNCLEKEMAKLIDNKKIAELIHIGTKQAWASINVALKKINK